MPHPGQKISSSLLQLAQTNWLGYMSKGNLFQKIQPAYNQVYIRLCPVSLRVFPNKRTESHVVSTLLSHTGNGTDLYKDDSIRKLTSIFLLTKHGRSLLFSLSPYRNSVEDSFQHAPPWTKNLILSFTTGSDKLTRVHVGKESFSKNPTSIQSSVHAPVPS